MKPVKARGGEREPVRHGASAGPGLAALPATPSITVKSEGLFSKGQQQGCSAPCAGSHRHPILPSRRGLHAPSPWAALPAPACLPAQPPAGSRIPPELGVCQPRLEPGEQRGRGRVLLPSRRHGASRPLAWTQLKARCVAPPVFTLHGLQFTVIKSFNTAIISLARAVLAGSDGERSWLTAARWTR